MPALAMMLEDWLLPKTFVETKNETLVTPAGTVTDAGTVAASGLSLDNATSSPPVRAAEVSATVPVTELPPTTSVALSLTVDSSGTAAEGGGGVFEVGDAGPAARAMDGPARIPIVVRAMAARFRADLMMLRLS